MTFPTCLESLFLFVVFLHLATTKSSAQEKIRIDDYKAVKAALNKKVWSSSKNYFTIIKATDSTVHLVWGNDTLKRTLDEELGIWPEADRLFIKWSNNDYLILEYWTGTNAWRDIVLPMNKKEAVQEFSNALYFDKVHNLLVIEQIGDAILAVENLKTLKEQVIFEKKHKCDSMFNYSCIAAIAIKNKVIYIKWNPNSSSDKGKTYEKKVKLQV